MLVMARKRLAEMSKEELWRLFPIELVEHRDVWEDYYKEEEENLLNTLGGCNQQDRPHWQYLRSGVVVQADCGYPPPGKTEYGYEANR